MAKEILPYEPSPSEKRKRFIREQIFGGIDDNYRANRLSQGIVDVADMIPFYGDLEGVREGAHLATEENSPLLGLGIGALSVLPFIPGSVTRAGTNLLREQAAKRGMDKPHNQPQLRVTPTQYTIEKTDPLSQEQAVEIEHLIYSDRADTEGSWHTDTIPPAFQGMFEESPLGYHNRIRPELATEGQPFTIETIAERSILNNPAYQNPNKKYSVQGLIQSTVNDVPGPARANLERQLNEWIPQEMKEGKATLQEVLDAIGSNKPRIHQQVDARPNAQLAREEIEDARSANTTPYIDRSSLVGGARSQTEAQNVGTVIDEQILDQASLKGLMPLIPTDGPVFSSMDAARTLMPLKYTEKNLSVQSDNYGTLFQDPGHHQVGASTRPAGSQNSANRIFTTRSGVYEIEGKRYLIPAEGQSGIYKFTKDEDKVRSRMTGVARDPNSPSDPLNISEIRSRLYNTDGPTLDDTSENLLSSDFLVEVEPRLREPHTLADWTQEVEYWRQLGEDAEATILYNRNLTPAGSSRNTLKENKKQLRAKMIQYDDELNRLEDVQGEAIHEAEVVYNTGHKSRERFEREVQDINNDFYAEREALQDQYANEREAAQELRLSQIDHVQTVTNELSGMFTPTNFFTSLGDTYPPLHKDWFPMHMKMSLNDAAVDKRIDGVRFPINGYAVQQQRGMEEVSPARMRQFSHEFDDIPNPDDPDSVGTTLKTIPSEKAQNLGEIYEKETNEAIKRIEAEYGIKLNGRVVEDDNLNQFLEIDMTPEIREAFQKVLMNRGGEVDKNETSRNKVLSELDTERGLVGLLNSMLDQQHMTVDRFDPSGQLEERKIILNNNPEGPLASDARNQADYDYGTSSIFTRQGVTKIIDNGDIKEQVRAVTSGWRKLKDQAEEQQGGIQLRHSFDVDGTEVQMTENEYQYLKNKLIHPDQQQKQKGRTTSDEDIRSWESFNLGGPVNMNNQPLMPLQYGGMGQPQGQPQGH